MRLKRAYEQRTREKLKRFGRWAWLAEKRNTSPLNRLFSELAGGKDIEKIREQIAMLIADPLIRKEALKLVDKHKREDFLDDGYAMRIDTAVAFILTNQYPAFKRFLSDFFHMLYIEQGNGRSMLQIARTIVARNYNGGEPFSEEVLTPAERQAFDDCVSLCYRRLRRIREQLETDIFHALEAISHLTGPFDLEATSSALRCFNERYFQKGEVCKNELDIVTRFVLPAETVNGYCKVM